VVRDVGVLVVQESIVVADDDHVSPHPGEEVAHSTAGRSTSGDWTAVRSVVDHAVDVRDDPDTGIREVRGGNEQFVCSMVTCWAALDRGVAVATAAARDAPVDSLRAARARIRADALEKGYDADLGSFVRFYGSDTVDATGLLLPVVGSLPFDDDRVRGTVDAAESRLVEDAVLVRRYDGDDGLPGSEGAFVLFPAG